MNHLRCLCFRRARVPHGCVLIKLRTLRHAGAMRDATGLRELLQTYVDQMLALVRDVEKWAAARKTMGRNVAIAAASNAAFAAVRYARPSLSKTRRGVILILASRFGVIVCHDDASLCLDHRRRSYFLICWVVGSREQAEKCDGNWARQGNSDDLKMGWSNHHPQ
jgi:hypothetical protein